jgi:hypothetical protein
MINVLNIQFIIDALKYIKLEYQVHYSIINVQMILNMVQNHIPQKIFRGIKLNQNLQSKVPTKIFVCIRL